MKIKVFVESQHPEDLPLDLMEEIHIPADRMSVEFRRAHSQKNLGWARHLSTNGFNFLIHIKTI
jgi:hypothetical protein